MRSRRRKTLMTNVMEGLVTITGIFTSLAIWMVAGVVRAVRGREYIHNIVDRLISIADDYDNKRNYNDEELLFLSIVTTRYMLKPIAFWSGI